MSKEGWHWDDGRNRLAVDWLLKDRGVTKEDASKEGASMVWLSIWPLYFERQEVQEWGLEFIEKMKQPDECNKIAEKLRENATLRKKIHMIMEK